MHRGCCRKLLGSAREAVILSAPYRYERNPCPTIEVVSKAEPILKIVWHFL